MSLAHYSTRIPSYFQQNLRSPLLTLPCAPQVQFAMEISNMETMCRTTLDAVTDHKMYIPPRDPCPLHYHHTRIPSCSPRISLHSLCPLLTLPGSLVNLCGFSGTSTTTYGRSSGRRLKSRTRSRPPSEQPTEIYWRSQIF